MAFDTIASSAAITFFLLLLFVGTPPTKPHSPTNPIAPVDFATCATGG